MSHIKILHTSDWHLGKKLFREDRIDEQKLFLDWLFDLLTKNDYDVLLVAGDIFDVANPPHHAQQLFYDFIYRLGVHSRLETVLITGNHDSKALFDIPKSFFKQHRCYIYNDLADQNEHYYCKNNKTVGIKLLPFFRNHELINTLGAQEKNTIEQEIQNYFCSFFSDWEKENLDYKILCSHHVFGHYQLAGSEQAIHLSGLESFPKEWVLDKFDYIALGHIHKKQVLSQNPPMIYCGSPIPMRFSEKGQKFVMSMQLAEELTYLPVEIPSFIALRQLKSTPEQIFKELDLLKEESKQLQKKIFLEVVLNMDNAKSNMADEIRDYLADYDIKLLSFIPQLTQIDEPELRYQDIQQLDLGKLFKLFYKNKFGHDDVPAELEQCFIEVMQEIKDADS